MLTYPENQSLEELVQEKTIVILEIGSTRCSACAAIKNKLSATVPENENIVSYYMSLDNHPEIASSLQIFSAPAVLVYVQGKLTIKEAGCFSLENIFMKINQYLEILEL